MGDFFSAVVDIFGSPTMYGSAVRLGGFLAFAALGELVAEKAGTINISVEGSLLAGAFAGTVGYHLTESSVVGLAGFFNAIIDPLARRAMVVEIPGLVDIPLIGPALFGQTWPTYLLYPLIPLTWWLLYRTRWGLEVRAVGENPQASDVSGIDVNKRRRQAIVYGGLLAGLGGAFLVLGQVGTFDTAAVGGRGFIAIAAVYFGGWTLRGTLLGVVVFGLADAFRLAVPGLGYQFNAQMLAALPYVLTIVVMVAITKQLQQPKALAQPFIRGLR